MTRSRYTRTTTYHPFGPVTLIIYTPECAEWTEQLGWVWVPVWFEDDVTREIIADAVDTFHRIIDDLKRGERAFYGFYMQRVDEQEKKYYFPEQPIYDPREMFISANCGAQKIPDTFVTTMAKYQWRSCNRRYPVPARRMR